MKKYPHLSWDCHQRECCPSGGNFPPDSRGEACRLLSSGSIIAFFWADKAEISGNEITVSSSKVPVPVKIRFGWMENPTVNLYNGAGFPAVPFELSTKQL